MISEDLDIRVPAGMAFDGAPEVVAGAYNENAFRHFLHRERRRAERSGRAMVLLLIELQADADGETHVPAPVARRLFTELQGCIREVDFLGWYRAGRVIGAVLTQGATTPAAEVTAQISARVSAALLSRLPARIARRLQVRVMQSRPTARVN